MKLPSFFTCFRLTKLIGLCLVMLMTSQNVSAFDLKMDNDNVSSTKKSSHLSYDSLISRLPTLFTFQERNAAYLFKEMKDRYLTFYSNKNEKLKATYYSGAYLITYSSHW